VYSLINAPVLGFDLARRPAGHLAADVIVRALCVGVDDLPALAAAHSDDPARDAAWLELALEERSSVAHGLRLAADRLTGGAPTDSVLSSLERLAVGDLDSLLRFVRHEVLDWTWRRATAGGIAVQDDDASAAAAVLCDAAASAYAADRLSPEARHRLAAPWLAVRRRMSDPAPELGPYTVEVLGLLERVATLAPPEVAALRAAVDAARPQVGEWATAMHAATWAVELSGRTRAAAAAQMLLVGAVHGGVSTRESARGAWNVLSGVVQATVVQDLLEPASVSVLVPPTATALGLV
jgi:hypothetical protein